MGGWPELRLVAVLSLVVQPSSLMPVFLLMVMLDCCLKTVSVSFSSLVSACMREWNQWNCLYAVFSLWEHHGSRVGTQCVKVERYFSCGSDVLSIQRFTDLYRLMAALVIRMCS